MTVAKGQRLQQQETHTVWISSNAGIKYPASGLVPRLPKTPEGVDGSLIASVNSFMIKWMSTFPSATNPRIGFIVQYTPSTWKRDVETVFIPDVLDRGIVTTVPIGWLASDLTDDVLDAQVVIGHGSESLYSGLVLQVDSERMLVVNSTMKGAFTTLRVRRAYLGTKSQSHSIVSSRQGCTCSIANGTAHGGSACTCTTVHLAFFGASNPDDGIDMKLPASLSESDVVCAGSNPDLYSCNPIRPMHTYHNNIRTHQSATIHGQLSQTTLSVAACGGSASICYLQGSACECHSTGLVYGTEFGNFLQGSKSTVYSTGDPLEYPISMVTSLRVAVSASADVTSLSVVSAENLANQFIRIGKEILFVTSEGSGNVVKVMRAVLGTSRAAHGLYAKIYIVPWPLQTAAELPDGRPGQYDSKRPGKHYDFRIAAVNRAGLSPFLYYGIKVYEVLPRKLACKGLNECVVSRVHCPNAEM